MEITRRRYRIIKHTNQGIFVSYVLLIIFLLFTGISAAATSLDSDPLHQLPTTSGKISHFSSRDVTGYCDGAAWGEKLGETCGTDDATKYWYVAMRWSYVDAETGSKEFYAAKDWWHDKKILVTNPSNGKQVVLAAKDWGPNEGTGRVIDVSETALNTLGTVTDATVNIEFADQNSALGLVNPVGEDPRIANAIGWAEKQIGSKEYYHDGYPWCLDFVEDAYETGAESAPTRPWSNAKEAADGLNAKNNQGLPPRGVFVFYEWTDPTCPDCGHVGISIGDGMIIHVPGASSIRKDKYTNVMGLKYIGWAYPPVTPPINSFKTAWEFNTPGDNESWAHHNIDAWSVETDGKFRIDPGPTDPWIDQPYISLDATFYNAVNINMASNAPDRVGAIYFTNSESSEFSEDKKVDFDVSNDDDWHDYSIFMGSQPMWTGTITGIRIDPADYGRKEGEVDSIGFDYIRVEHSHIILDQSIYPNVASTGDELTFVFNIDNPFSNDIEKVRLGARIRTHDPQGKWIDDMPNDNTITLKPGANVYSRVFKTPADLSDGLYDAEWVVMDEGTKRWIDHEDMCPILTISSGSTPNPTSTSQPTSAPTAVESPTPGATPTDGSEKNNVIEVITSSIKEFINTIVDLLDKLL